MWKLSNLNSQRRRGHHVWKFHSTANISFLIWGWKMAKSHARTFTYTSIECWSLEATEQSPQPPPSLDKACSKHLQWLGVKFYSVILIAASDWSTGWDVAFIKALLEVETAARRNCGCRVNTASAAAVCFQFIFKFNMPFVSSHFVYRKWCSNVPSNDSLTRDILLK